MSSPGSLDDWTENEGDSTDCEEEVPAAPSLRGRVAIVTVRCPRRYPRQLRVRKEEGLKIPADMGKLEFLRCFRQVVSSHCSQKLISATCHGELHGRKRKSTQLPEKKIRLAVRMQNYFPHRKIADAFQKKHGLKITFNFMAGTWERALGVLMTKGAVELLDLEPEKYPTRLGSKKKKHGAIFCFQSKGFALWRRIR